MKGKDRLSVVTIVMHSLHHTYNGDANEDFTVKDGVIRIHLELFFSKYCAVEAGLQVAKIGAWICKIRLD